VETQVAVEVKTQENFEEIIESKPQEEVVEWVEDLSMVTLERFP
jgi:predicted house-cleaning noncanonical NTP pyrophosphatase (MazG superfamily)